MTAPRRSRRAGAARAVLGLVIGAGAALFACAAAAQQPPDQSPAPAAPAERESPTPGPTGAAAPPPSAPAGLWDRSTLLGDIGGLRPLLGNYGITVGLTETSEVFGNVSGGRNRGAIYEGLTEMTLGVDFDKAFGLTGGNLNVSAFQIHGRGLSANYLDNLNTASGIEADRATRLFELWYQQNFFNDAFDVRIGQQSADQEFIISQYGGLFINSSFGWPTLAAVDLPAGGPSYPLATPALRLRVHPTDAVTGLLGLYNGNPAGNGPGDPQLRDPSGTNFATGDGAFVIGEAQYATTIAGRAGTYKLGAWYNSNRFPDPFYEAGGIPAGGPLAGRPASFHGDWSFYAVMDQLVYRAPGAKDGGFGFFARIMGAPDDRNEVDFFGDGGVTYAGAFGRDGDTMGVGLGWARIGDAARAGDAAMAAAAGGFYPVRGSETVLEVTYQAQVAPWWTVQPDFQYVFNPGGGILAPSGGHTIGNETVLGVRTTITF